MGGVRQHDLQQLCGEPGRQDTAAKALPHQHGQTSAVIDVGVGNQHVVHGVGGKGQVAVINFIPPLLQAAVHQDLFPVALHAVAAAGDSLGRAEKGQFHRAPP